MGRSTARRMLTGGVLPHPTEQLDQRRLRQKGFSDDARVLLEHVWTLMGFPCGKYVKVMVPLCLPTMVEAGDVDKPFATAEALAAVGAMSAATGDRHPQPARHRVQSVGICFPRSSED